MKMSKSPSKVRSPLFPTTPAYLDAFHFAWNLQFRCIHYLQAEGSRAFRQGAKLNTYIIILQTWNSSRVFLQAGCHLQARKSDTSYQFWWSFAHIFYHVPGLGSALGYLLIATEAIQKYCRPTGCSLAAVLLQPFPKATGPQQLYKVMLKLLTRVLMQLKRHLVTSHILSGTRRHQPTPCPVAIHPRQKMEEKKSYPCLSCPLKSYRYLYLESSFRFCILKTAEIGQNLK